MTTLAQEHLAATENGSVEGTTAVDERYERLLHLLDRAIAAATSTLAGCTQGRGTADWAEHIEALLLNLRSLHRRTAAGQVWGLGEGVELGALRYMADWWDGPDNHPLVRAVEELETYYADATGNP